LRPITSTTTAFAGRTVLLSFRLRTTLLLLLAPLALLLLLRFRRWRLAFGLFLWRRLFTRRRWSLLRRIDLRRPLLLFHFFWHGKSSLSNPISIQPRASAARG
jgi:hypothetical protein